MTNRIHNFSAGPAVLPEPVLEEARDALLNLHGSGIGICEHSHRGREFMAIAEEAESLCRELAQISDEYHVLFLQGGASTQFAMLPMNFLEDTAIADYLVTGSWSLKAVAEARNFGDVNTVCSSQSDKFNHIPVERDYSAHPAYVHFTSNNTIYGTQFSTEPTDIPRSAFLACDASSDIYSRPLDVSKYGLIYAGAQKNLGPSGVTLVIIRDDLIRETVRDVPTMLEYKTHADKGSMFNTPPTFGIYLMMLVFRWLKEHGGLEAAAERNERKAAKLYDAIDASSLFKGTAQKTSRSKMNVTFVTGDADQDAAFIEQATAAGFSGLKGHRSVGGMRASIYNAFPETGVDALIQFMQDFEAKG